MNYKSILHYNPHYKLVNINNISNRLLELTKGNVFIVFNTIRSQYELHTVNSFKLSGDSFNSPINQEDLNAWLLYDFRIHNHHDNMDDIKSMMMESEAFKDKREQERFNVSNMMKLVERSLGTKI